MGGSCGTQYRARHGAGLLLRGGLIEATQRTGVHSSTTVNNAVRADFLLAG
ncbi:hypothetical protein [Paraburkholderia fungorum]|uniref:hypothetical protein n=1 Tax=Paraburkholderia fungorum TaxID=134537 RepID=UPI0038B93420